MPNQFFSPEGDLENYFATEYWLVDQYVGDTLYAWGFNSNGQIGNNTTASRSTPTQEFTFATNWAMVSSNGNSGLIGTPVGAYHVAAIKTDGTLWVWGNNNYGQLGDVTIISRSTPRQISPGNFITGWKQVSCGSWHTAAINSTGNLWIWGRNNFSQLGINLSGAAAPARSIPLRVSLVNESAIGGWKQVACGGLHTAAIAVNNSLYSWGLNNSGQLGHNNIISKSTPSEVFGAATNWKQVATGYSHTAAIKTDETLWTWGRNFYGELGINVSGTGASAYRSTPTQVTIASADGISGWKRVSCSFYNTSAIKTNGTLWVWGINTNGQIGDNTNDGGTLGVNARSTPRQEFTASTNWKQVSSASNTTVAIKTNGTLWGWGYNALGTIGDNTNANRSTPRQEASSSTNWKTVFNGANHTIAIKAGVELD